MTSQTDVLASAPLTSTGAFTDGTNNLARARIKGIYCVCSASAGSVIITNGSGGATLANIATPTLASAGYVYIPLPGEGILAQTSVYGTVVNTTSTVLFYA